MDVLYGEFVVGPLGTVPDHLPRSAVVRLQSVQILKIYISRGSEVMLTGVVGSLTTTLLSN